MASDAELAAISEALAHLRLTTTGYLKSNGQPKPDPWPEGSAHWAPAIDLLEGVGADPDPAPNPGLPFAEADVQNPLRPALAQGATSFACETGKDYVFDLGWIPRPGIVFTGAPRRVQIRNYYVRALSSGSAYARGGIGLQLRAEHVSITGYYTEPVPYLTDAIRIACRPTTRVTLQNALVEMPADSQEPTEHVDSLQIQGAIGRLEVGSATFQVAAVRVGNDGGKGFQLDVLSAIGEVGAPFSVDLRRVSFQTLATPATGARSIMAIGKDDQSSIAISLSEVYGGGSLPFASHLVNYPEALASAISGSAGNRVMTFTKPAQGWSGEYRELGARPHFVTKASLGL